MFKLTSSGTNSSAGTYVFGISTNSADHYALWLGPRTASDGSELPYNNTTNIQKNALFRVTKQGKITAIAGTIGGWTITEAALESKNQDIYLSNT